MVTVPNVLSAQRHRSAARVIRHTRHPLLSAEGLPRGARQLPPASFVAPIRRDGVDSTLWSPSGQPHWIVSARPRGIYALNVVAQFAQTFPPVQRTRARSHDPLGHCWGEALVVRISICRAWGVRAPFGSINRLGSPFRDAPASAALIRQSHRTARRGVRCAFLRQLPHRV